MATKKKETPVAEAEAAAPASTELTTTGGVLATNDKKAEIALPQDMSWLNEHNDEFDRSEIAIPMIKLLQDTSPYVKSRDAKYVQGAEPGMIMESTSRELFDGSEGIVVIPIMYQQSVTEWIPRDKGGGFVADHGNDLTYVQAATPVENKGLILPNGNQVVHAAMYFCLILNEAQDDFIEAIVLMTGYGWKASRNWNTMMMRLNVTIDGKRVMNPPVFSGVWRLRSAPEKNSKGDFFRWGDPEYLQSTFSHPMSDRLLAYARNFRERIKAGKAKFDVGAMADE